MNAFEQLARFLCVPIAMSLFLLAAQASGGLELRDAAVLDLAMK